MTPDFFKTNRHNLITQVGGVIVLTAHTQMQRSNDAAYAFEQEANFWWASGIEQPDWWIIIDGTTQDEWLVIPHVSDIHQVFDGSLSAERASAISGVSKVISYDEALGLLRRLAAKHPLVYTLGPLPYAEHFDFMLNPAQKKVDAVLERLFVKREDCRQDMARLRAIKQPVEIAAMKRAINVTIDAFEHVKTKLPTLSYEYEIEAEFSYYFRSKGARGHAYDPIVASGKNACTLHYGENNVKLRKKSMVLLDIGARVDGYAADVTRTYAYCEVTNRQKLIHEAVQDAQAQIIKLLEPKLSVEQYQRDVDTIMRQTLVDVGLIASTTDDAGYRMYFPHAISHGLGIDVHDSLGKPKYLEAGMVLTVEPGIYIPKEGIGVRIEDDILITSSGHDNLSKRLSTELA